MGIDGNGTQVRHGLPEVINRVGVTAQSGAGGCDCHGRVAVHGIPGFQVGTRGGVYHTKPGTPGGIGGVRKSGVLQRQRDPAAQSDAFRRVGGPSGGTCGGGLGNVGAAVTQQRTGQTVDQG